MLSLTFGAYQLISGTWAQNHLCNKEGAEDLQEITESRLPIMVWERGGWLSDQCQRNVSEDHTEHLKKDETDRPRWQTTDQ